MSVAARYIAAILACIVFPLVCRVTVLADERVYRETDAGWSIRLPQGWRQMHPESVADANKFVDQSLGTKRQWSYTGGVAHESKGDFEGSYILIQTTRSNLAGTTYDQIEKAFGLVSLDDTGKKIEQAVPGLTNTQFSKPTLDRARGRVYINTQSEIAGVGVLKGISVGFLGKDGMISLCYNAPESEYEQGLSDFQRLVDSFRFDPGYAFIPHSKSLGGGSFMNWNRVFGAALAGGLISGVGALIRALITRQKAHAKQHEESETG